MAKLQRFALRAALSLAVLAAMTLGASEAFGASRAFACLGEPPNMIGECTDQNACDTECRFGYNAVAGNCVGGCCFCEF